MKLVEFIEKLRGNSMFEYLTKKQRIGFIIASIGAFIFLVETIGV